MIKIFILFFTGVLFLGCNQKSSYSKTEVVLSEESSGGIECELFTPQLNKITDKYIGHVRSQDELKGGEQLIMISFSIIEGDTTLNFSTSEYLGEFEVNSSLRWRFKGSVGDNKIFVGDTDPLIGAKYYNRKNLKDFQEKQNKYKTNLNYTDPYFENSSWSYTLINGKFVRIE